MAGDLKQAAVWRIPTVPLAIVNILEPLWLETSRFRVECYLVVAGSNHCLKAMSMLEDAAKIQRSSGGDKYESCLGIVRLLICTCMLLGINGSLSCQEESVDKKTATKSLDTKKLAKPATTDSSAKGKLGQAVSTQLAAPSSQDPTDRKTKRQANSVESHASLIIALAGLAVGVVALYQSRLGLRLTQIVTQLDVRERRVKVRNLVNTAWDLIGGGAGVQTIRTPIQDTKLLEQARRILEDEVFLYDPKNLQAYCCMSAYLAATDQIEEAAEFLVAALEIFPKSILLLSNLGAALIQLGDLEEAESILNVAFDLDPDFPPVLYNSGGIAFLKRDWRQASMMFRRTICFDRKHAHAFYFLGLSLLKQDLVEDARCVFDRVAQLDHELWSPDRSVRFLQRPLV